MPKASPSDVLAVSYQFVPSDVAKLIARTHVHTCVKSWDDPKVGQIIFPAPCGHMLRCKTGYKYRDVILPGETDVKCVKKYIYERATDRCFVESYFKECSREIYYEWADYGKYQLKCHICKRYWTKTNETTDLQDMILCFCGKFIT